MTPNYAKSQSTSFVKKSVVFIVYDGIKMLDLAGPLQVFNDATLQNGQTCYQCSIASEQGEAICTDTGLAIESVKIDDLPKEEIDILLVVGGDGSSKQDKNIGLTSLIKKLAGRSSRIGSICTGARILAAAGLLDNKKVVTHWSVCDELARNYTQVEVLADSIYVQDGNLWTSAGVTSGIDMALAMVSVDYDRDCAIRLAQHLVTYFVRPGGQSQFSNLLNAQSKDGFGKFDRLHSWLSQNLARSISVESMSDFCGMSPRTFARQYKNTTGVSPANSLEIMRVEAAGALLQDEYINNKTIANVCGFLNYEQMRRAFMRHYKVSPVTYREKFGS